MIPVQELRIGNWIIDAGCGRIQVRGEMMDEDLWRGENAFPIPLTPEILIACGFKKFSYPDHSGRKMRDMYFLNCDYLQITFVMGETVLAGKNDSDIDAQAILSKSIRHLHQLQNLHFALTNKELQYSPQQ